MCLRFQNVYHVFFVELIHIHVVVFYLLGSPISTCRTCHHSERLVAVLVVVESGVLSTAVTLFVLHLQYGNEWFFSVTSLSGPSECVSKHLPQLSPSHHLHIGMVFEGVCHQLVCSSAKVVVILGSVRCRRVLQIGPLFGKHNPFRIFIWLSVRTTCVIIELRE